ncbi:MAG: 16S rRNA (adenine(1518)-N(6)/adenine(1519)-N(6))-dimethyltransferase RsmA [Robiginitomaculum sp.]|nr:16S rRNA (adenine(1518)-N(6)/adenine(1519)-N(6))-dimethyltransferase RsmA [Robiginitomaculum sp.]
MDSLPTLTASLKAHNLFAKKSFGQHFLLDQNLTDKIARLAVPHEAVIEIGPGPGGLTRSLLNMGVKKLYAIEKDPRFISLLQEIENVSDGRLNVFEADALKVDLAALDSTRPLRVCANLPYNVGTKLLINWLHAQPIFWDRLVLMLQKEVAMRIAAQPNTKPYGRLAVLAQSITAPHIAFEVPAHAFTPPPKVDSAVIVLDILPQGERYADLKMLGRVTASAFGQRRKMLRKSLRALAGDLGIDLETWLGTANIDPSVRPETIDIKGFHRLSDTANALR